MPLRGVPRGQRTAHGLHRAPSVGDGRGRTAGDRRGRQRSDRPLPIDGVEGMDVETYSAILEEAGTDNRAERGGDPGAHRPPFEEAAEQAASEGLNGSARRGRGVVRGRAPREQRVIGGQPQGARCGRPRWVPCRSALALRGCLSPVRCRMARGSSKQAVNVGAGRVGAISGPSCIPDGPSSTKSKTRGDNRTASKNPKEN